MPSRCVASALLLVACSDPGDRIVVVAFDPQTQDYALEPRQFETLTDVRELRGTVTRIKGGAEFVIDERVASAPDLEEALGRAVRSEGNAVKFSAVESDGAWVPTDYHSLGMATVYWNLERAASFFEEQGLAPEELGSIPTFYFVKFEIDLPGQRGSLTDNAAYSVIPGFDGFLILAQRILDDLPLGMNLGVMVHEYGHAVMARLRFGTPPDPDLSKLVGGPCALSMLDEGNSDYFGAVATGDSDFIRWSIGPTLVDRDLAEERILGEYEEAASLVECGDTDPHLAGAVWAALLWAIGEAIGHDALAPILVDALREFATSEATTLPALADAVASRLAEADRAIACPLIQERFAPVADEVTACLP